MTLLKRTKIISILLLVTFGTSVICPYRAMADDAGIWSNGGWILGPTTTPPPPKDDEPPEEPPSGCTPFQGDPVSVFSGEQSYTCLDLYIPGRGMDLAIYHSYKSGFHGMTSFGYGWGINYHERVILTSDGNASVVRGAGRKDTFTALGGGVYAPPAGIFESLVQNVNGTWTLTLAHGEKHNFNTSGALVSIVDRNNNTISFTYDNAGLLPTTGIPLLSGIGGAVPAETTHDYRLTQITDTLGRNVDLNYNSSGRLTSIVDFNGRTVSFTYDTAGNLLTITRPATTQFPSGVTKTFTYDGDHNLLTIKDGKNQTFVTNYYDASDRVYQQTLGAGIMTFNYAVAGQTTFTDRVGNVTTYVFNSNGNASSTEQFTSGVRAGDPASFITTNTYNSDTFSTSVTYPKGNGVKYTYDSNNVNRRARGNLLQVRRKADMAQADNDTNDIVVNMTYEPNFNFVKAITDGKGNVTTMTYDYELPTNDSRYGTKGNLVTITFPTAGSQTPTLNYTYNSYGQLTQIQDAKGNITQYTYHSSTGLLASISRDPSTINATTQFTYDSNGNVDTVTDPLSNVTDYNYDAMGWLNQVTDAMGYVTKYTYDANGNIARLERQANAGATVWQTTDYTYDTLNNLKTITDPLSRVTTFNYNNNEDMTSKVDANGKTTSYQYDERRLLFKVTDANSPAGVTQYDYDTNGNLKKITDANTNATNYAFDNFDRLTATTYANSSTEQLAYDKNSNVTSRTLPSTKVINYVYDALNRMTAKNYPANSPINVTYGYDIASLLTSANTTAAQIGYVYDALDRQTSVTQTINSTAYTTGYQFDKNNNRTQVTYPSGKVVTYQYDTNNNTSAILVNSVDLVSYTYDPLARRTQKDYVGSPTLRASYQYDLADQLLSLTNTVVPSPAISQFTYTYDNTGNRLTMTTGGATQNYAYDPIYQLTAVTGAQTHSYAYDKLGNRTSADGIAYTSNNLNQYLTVNGVNQTYSADGNLTNDGTQTYSYDEENRLTAAGTSTYIYDAFNRRVGKNVGGTAAYYVHDGDHVIEERNSSGTLVADYTYGPTIDETLTMTRSGNTFRYFYDGLGSARNITNAGGTVIESYDYDPFGKPTITSAIGNPVMFTGRWYDAESGNYYYRNRYMNPNQGRFMQKDPIAKDGGFSIIGVGLSNGLIGFTEYSAGKAINGDDKQNLLTQGLIPNNLYFYADNNPINFVDPDGNAPQTPGDAQCKAECAALCAFVPFPQKAACSFLCNNLCEDPLSCAMVTMRDGDTCITCQQCPGGGGIICDRHQCGGMCPLGI